MTYAARGGASLDMNGSELESLFSQAVSRALNDIDDRRPVIIIPPDGTRPQNYIMAYGIPNPPGTIIACVYPSVLELW
jgi:hypothetical protein